jgi:hypothetical protein
MQVRGVRWHLPCACLGKNEERHGGGLTLLGTFLMSGAECRSLSSWEKKARAGKITNFSRNFSPQAFTFFSLPESFSNAGGAPKLSR